MKKLCCILGIILLVAVCGFAQAREKVLLVFSYHPEYSWVIEETKGVEDVFKGRGIRTEKFYLDTKRRTSTEWKKKVAEEAVRKIEEFGPNLVIVFDDNACELVAKRYIGASLPFVFCGVNAEPADYGFPAENITGVLERALVKESIELLQRIVPDVKKAAIVTDNSPTAQAFVTRVKQMTLPIEICQFYATNNFDLWKAKIRELQTKVDAIGLFTYHTIKEKDGEMSLPPETIMEWTLKNSMLPEFTSIDFVVNDGALCGVINLSGYGQGKAAAEIALMILAGARPVNISIRCPDQGISVVNETRAEQLNIKIPEDVRKEVQIVY